MKRKSRQLQKNRLSDSTSLTGFGAFVGVRDHGPHHPGEDEAEHQLEDLEFFGLLGLLGRGLASVGRVNLDCEVKGVCWSLLSLPPAVVKEGNLRRSHASGPKGPAFLARGS